MSDSFHGIALAQKVPEAHIPILYFKLFGNNNNLSPFGFVDDAIATLVYPVDNVKLAPFNLNIVIKLSWFCDSVNIELRWCLDFLAYLFYWLAFLQ